ncbi:sensor histidine kinase, partial [Psychrobacter sp. 16-Bac2893]
MFTIESIANKFRISYLLFALLLCTTFVSIFMYAEMRIEQDLVKGRLLQQLQLSQEKEGEQAAYTANPGIKIYRYDSAPENLKAIANGTVQEMQVTVNNQTG